MTLPGAVVDDAPPATLAEGLARPAVAPVFLAEVGCGLSLPVWTEGNAGILYGTPVVDEVTGVSVNGTALTYTSSVGWVGSIAAVSSTAGSWYWDREFQMLYVHLADNGDPSDPAYSVEASLIYRFSDTNTDAGGYAWLTYIDDLPSLTSRIPETFRGLAQVGGGRLGLLNGERFFDSDFNQAAGDGVIVTGPVRVPGRLRQNWAAANTVLRMGVAGLDYPDFETLATLANGGLAVDKDAAILDLKEIKTRIDKPYPLNLYTRDEFPLMREQDEGRAKQVSFGAIYGVNPVCINTLTREFKVADHPIKSFDGVRVKDNTSGVWAEVNFQSVDEPNALFTLSASDWNDGQEVAVDFSGWVRDDATLADNPAEIVKAVLVDLGQAYSSAEFEIARLWYDAGYYGQDTGDRITLHPPSLYLDDQASALDTLQNLCGQVRAYLLVNAAGEFQMKPFRLYQASGLETLHDELDTLGEGLKRDVSGANKPVISKAQVFYRIRPSEGIRSVEVYEATANQYKRAGLTPVLESAESFFTQQRDAQWLAQCMVNEGRVDRAIYTATVKWRAWTWTVGQHLHVVSDRLGLDVVLEILGVSLNLKTRVVDLTLGNLRGFEEAAGFWTLSTDQTPTGASLVWPSGGQVPDDESQYKRHETGIWHNSKHMATDTPLTALDRAVSLWQ